MANPFTVILVLLGFFGGAAAQSPTAAPTNMSNITTSTPFPTIPPFIPPQPPAVETTPRASRPNPQLTDNIREVFLDMHNRLRGSIARGQTERNGNLGIAPPAFLMYKMRYDCNAESQSNFAGAAQWAMASWWSQLAKFGIRTDMLFTERIRRRRNRNIRKFTKMAWWNNVRLGCAIRNCGSFIFTSCMYAPGDNYVGQHVYQVGAVCGGCPSGCENGLCPSP
ncbi:hypothetical protein Aduo_004170 [Ancylostoma duodenale]